jgi:hypothetical protein
MDDFERAVRGMHIDGKIDLATMKSILALHEAHKGSDDVHESAHSIGNSRAAGSRRAGSGGGRPRVG